MYISNHHNSTCESCHFPCFCHPKTPRKSPTSQATLHALVLRGLESPEGSWIVRDQVHHDLGAAKKIGESLIRMLSFHSKNCRNSLRTTGMNKDYIFTPRK